MSLVCFQRNSSSLSPERSKYEWSGNRSPDVASESGKRRKIDDKVRYHSCNVIFNQKCVIYIIKNRIKFVLL